MLRETGLVGKAERQRNIHQRPITYQRGFARSRRLALT